MQKPRLRVAARRRRGGGDLPTTQWEISHPTLSRAWETSKSQHRLPAGDTATAPGVRCAAVRDLRALSLQALVCGRAVVMTKRPSAKSTNP